MHTQPSNKTTSAAGNSSASWVLITGASSGFGEEFARQYAEQGHALVLVARRLDRLQAIAETIRQQHRVEVVVEQVDLSDVAAIIRLQERLRERGIAIDIGKINLLHDDLNAVLLANGLGDGLKPVQTTRHQDQRMALLGVLAGELLAEATRCARDENPRCG